MNKRQLAFHPILLMTVLAACQPTRESVAPAAPVEPEPQIDMQALREEAEAAVQEEIRLQLALADVLYAGLRALAEDRLMTPPEGSALSLFNRVLNSQPDNAVALQGIRDIAGRYLELASAAARQGQFDSAANYLRRAESVLPGHEGLAAAWQSLELERSRTHSVHSLDGRQLLARDAALVARLGELAAQARELEAFVMITAPNDAHGRWVYAQMQDSLPDYRLRADIEIGERPAVRLVLPQVPPQA